MIRLMFQKAPSGCQLENRARQRVGGVGWPEQKLETNPEATVMV